MISESMNVQTESNEAPGRKIPFKFTLYTVLIACVPVYLTFAELLYTKVVTFGQTMQLYCAASLQVIIILCLIIPVSMRYVFGKDICAYDGTGSLLDKANFAAKTWPTVIVAIPPVSCPLVALSIARTSAKLGFPVTFATAIGASVGQSFLISEFIYIFYIEEYERWLSFLPLRSKDLSLSVKMRVVLATVFSIIGIAAMNTVPFNSPALKSMPMQSILVRYFLPLSAYSGILTLINFWRLVQGITGRLEKISAFSGDLAEGNYTRQKIPVESRDDMGVLINQLNRFYDTTKGLLVKVNDTISTSQRTAENLSSNMTETSASVEQIIANINSVKNQIVNQSSGVDEAGSTVHEILVNLEKLDQTIIAQSASVAEASAAVEEMVANIRSVNQILGNNTKIVDALADSSNSGQQKVTTAVAAAEQILSQSSGLLEASSVVQNIAEQTNLLAMNAAIEAAHAGEAGKGFAVVADEIRKLAEQSNAQGKTISAHLKELEDAITNVTVSTKEMEQQFTSIYEQAQNVRTQETVIAQAMEEQSGGSDQVLQAMKNINDTTITVKQGSEEILTGSKQIVTEMDILGNVTQTISSAMEEMASGSTQIASAVGDVNEDSVKNKQGIESIVSQMSVFKV